jgi:hypothetical protein
LLSERVEEREDACRRRPAVRACRFFEPRPVGGVGALEVRIDQVVLGVEEAVERRRRDVGLGGDPVHPDRADARPVEELVRDAQHVLSRVCRGTTRRLLLPGRHASHPHC